MAPMPEIAGATAVKSRFFFVIALPSGNSVLASVVTNVRMVVTPSILAIVEDYGSPREIGPWANAYAARHGIDIETLVSCVGDLVANGFLWLADAGDEGEQIAAYSAAYYDRSPDGVGLWQIPATEAPPPRRELFSVSQPRELADYEARGHRFKWILLGACDLELGMDIRRRVARENGIDAAIVLGHSNDAFEGQVARERPDVVIIGALENPRHVLMTTTFDERWDYRTAESSYVTAVRQLLVRLRAHTSVPLLVHNLPVPTVSPLGLADRGPASHRHRVAATNLQLAALALELDDVFIVDVDAVLSLHGKRGLLDDVYATFDHLGSLRWITQVPEAAKESQVRGVFPPWSQLAEAFGEGDPFEYDRCIAREEISIITSALKLGQKKCVVVDLDGTLWPGVLAETGSPFPKLEEVQFQYISFVGLYRGLHQALKALRARGILLVCVSKNDLAVVEPLWRYPYDDADLLKLEDFASYRINWDEKVDNIRSIAEELHISTDAMVFIDDNPIEREKVKRFLPEITVLGENPFAIRAELLSSPRLQPAKITTEARSRVASAGAQVARDRLRESAVDPEKFLASLELECRIARLANDDLERVHELVSRTNQFNTTTRRYSKAELRALLDGGSVYTLRVQDRFTAYGLVGVCCVRDDVIELFAMSCRVIGLGVEGVFMHAILSDLALRGSRVEGAYVPTDRNGPARDLFRSTGFEELDGGRWERSLAKPLPAPAAYYRVVDELRAG